MANDKVKVKTKEEKIKEKKEHKAIFEETVANLPELTDTYLLQWATENYPVDKDNYVRLQAELNIEQLDAEILELEAEE